MVAPSNLLILETPPTEQHLVVATETEACTVNANKRLVTHLRSIIFIVKERITQTIFI